MRRYRILNDIFAEKDDPDWDEDDDYIVAEFSGGLHIELESDFGIADGENHNQFRYLPDLPMKDEFHCWLYHQLYDHTLAGWADILRIGTIWFDLEIHFQNEMGFS